MKDRLTPLEKILGMLGIASIFIIGGIIAILEIIRKFAC